jgi:hypothetical protein
LLLYSPFFSSSLSSILLLVFSFSFTFTFFLFLLIYFPYLLLSSSLISSPSFPHPFSFALLPRSHFSFIYLTSTIVHSGNERISYVGRMKDKTITKFLNKFEHRGRKEDWEVQWGNQLGTNRFISLTCEDEEEK